jgi:hypothetical protein
MIVQYSFPGVRCGVPAWDVVDESPVQDRF